MKGIAIYNNKGGVGKSTVTLFLADFFSSSSKIAWRGSRILVVDLDGQCSSSISLLGLDEVGKIKSERRCVSHLLLNLQEGKPVELADYLTKREKGHTSTKKIPLGELWVMANDRDSAIKFEDNCDRRRLIKSVKALKELITSEFDIVFIDLPANIDKRNKISLIGLLFADYILAPTEPTRITLNAMSDTFKLIQYVRYVNASANDENARPEIAGIVLNKTDRRTLQYTRHIEELKGMAAKNNTIVFDNFLPAAPTLSTASDDSMDFATLKERYDNYYDNVRKVAVELEKRCRLNSV